MYIIKGLNIFINIRNYIYVFENAHGKLLKKKKFILLYNTCIRSVSLKP